MKSSIYEKFPRSLEDAVDRLVSDLSFADKTRIANMSEDRLVEFHKSYGSYIRTEFRLPGNDPLMRSCEAVSGLRMINGVQASYVILKALWNRLQGANVLRVVKK